MVRINKKIYCVIVLIFSVFLMQSKTEQPAIKIISTYHEKVPLQIGIIGKSAELQQCASFLKHDLSFTNQFTIAIANYDQIPQRQEMQALYKKGYSLALFITHEDENNSGWRLYDTMHVKMLAGKKYHKEKKELYASAHALANMVWPVLTGQPGFFTTKIAFCKDVKIGQKVAKHIYVADYDGNNQQLLVDSPTVNIAPRWNNDAANPLIFYSEYANANVRLTAISMQKKRRVVSDYDGLNMVPSFSSDGKKVVYCASRGDGNCHVYYYDFHSFKRLTHNSGNNVSPTISNDGAIIYFCSDFEAHYPQIYRYSLSKDELSRITEGGYCACPHYSAKRQQLVYGKMINGIMQLFVYDEITKEHTQLTFDTAQKEECAWSACGNFIMYAWEKEKKKKIALFNLLTHKTQFLTNERERCSYPAWSPSYSQYVQVLS